MSLDLKALVAAIVGVLAAPVKLELPGSEVPQLALPPGWTAQDLDESDRPLPRRVIETVTVTTPEDFIAYVNRYKEPNSLLLVSPELLAVTDGQEVARAVLDYHTPGTSTTTPSAVPGVPDSVKVETGARHGDHVVRLTAKASPEYALLRSIDGKLFDQPDFARTLNDSLCRFCTSHAAADLVELARTLVLTSSGEYESIKDDFSGSIRLGYRVKVDAQSTAMAAKGVEIPTHFTFRVPLLLGGAPMDMRAEFYYRVPRESGQPVKLGIRLPDRQLMELEAIAALRKVLAEGTGLLTVAGKLGQ